MTGSDPLQGFGIVLGQQEVGDDVVADQEALGGQDPAAGVGLGGLEVAAALFQHLLQRGEGQHEQPLVLFRADAGGGSVH